MINATKWYQASTLYLPASLRNLPVYVLIIADQFNEHKASKPFGQNIPPSFHPFQLMIKKCQRFTSAYIHYVRLD